MKSFFYPTQPEWFEDLLLDWKNSGKDTLGFPFLWYTPTTLPADKDEKFWMYLYYSKTKTKETSLKQVVKFRVHVINYDFSIIENTRVHNRIDVNNEDKVWFQCDVAEEIRRADGSFLLADDFLHIVEGTKLLQSIRNSIAPVNCLVPIVTVQVTKRFLNK